MKSIKTLIAIVAIAILSGCEATPYPTEPVAEVTNQPSEVEIVTINFVNFFNKKDTKLSREVLKKCNVQKITISDLKAKAIIADGEEEKCFEAFLGYAKEFETSPAPVAFKTMEVEVRKFIAPKSMMEKAADSTKSGIDTVGEYTQKGADYAIEGGKKLFNNVKDFFSSDEEEKTAKTPAPVKTL